MSNQSLPENNDGPKDNNLNDVTNDGTPLDEALIVPNFVSFAYGDEGRCAMALAEAQAHLEKSAKAKTNSNSNLPRLTYRNSARSQMEYALRTARQLDETNEETLNGRVELLHQLGSSCIHLKRYDEAVDYLLREYKMLRKNSGTEDLRITEAISRSSMVEIVELACCLISLCTALLAAGNQAAYEDYLSFLINCLMVFEEDSQTEEQTRCLRASEILLELQDRCMRVNHDSDKCRVLIENAVYSDELVI